MSMSKQDFVAITAQLKHHIDGKQAGDGMVLPDHVQGIHNAYCGVVATALQGANSNFKRGLFLKAAGATDWMEW